MELIIGGRNQGKLEYFLSGKERESTLVLEGAELPASEEALREVLRAAEEGSQGKQNAVLNHLHLWVRTCAEKEADAEALFALFREYFPDPAVISDEIGNGIVPNDPLEREWREETGRLLRKIAKDADHVVRVVCGLPQVIK